MYSEIFGYRVNLIRLAMAVASYDLVHIVWELKLRAKMMTDYEYTDYGCMGDLFQAHCVAIYSDLTVYIVDFVFTCYLLYGASKLKPFPVLCWLLLSSYHLIDFILVFTPIYGHAYSFSDLPFVSWCDIFVSILGFLYVIYFYKKLLKADIGAIQRERLTDVDKLKLTGVDLEA